nr:uncharacterized protein LOC127325599 isoform X2 [Lolium perenne]
MAVTIFSPNPAPTTAAYPTLLVADHRSSGAFNRAPSRNPSRPTKSVAHSIALTRGRNPGVPLSMRPVPAPATTLPARPRSGWSCGAAVQPQMYVLPIRRIPGLTPAHVGDQPTADAESIRRCIRVERDPSPRRPRASTSPATVSRSRSRTAYPGSSRRKAKERPAGVRRWPTTTQNGSSTPTSTAKEELVRSDDAHQFKDGVDIQLTEESRRGSAPVCCYAGGVDDGVGTAAAPIVVRPMSVGGAGSLCSPVPNSWSFCGYTLA